MPKVTINSLIKDVDLIKSKILEITNVQDQIISKLNSSVINENQKHVLNLSQNLKDMSNNNYHYNVEQNGQNVPVPFVLGIAINLLMSNIPLEFMTEDFVDIHIETMSCLKKVDPKDTLLKTNNSSVIDYLILLAQNYKFITDNEQLNYSIKCEIITILKQAL